MTLRYNQQLYQCTTATRPEDGGSQANQYYECNGADAFIADNCVSTLDEISIKSLAPWDTFRLSTITVTPISGSAVTVNQYICIADDGGCSSVSDIVKIDINTETLTYGASLTTNCTGLKNIYFIPLFLFDFVFI